MSIRTFLLPTLLFFSSLKGLEDFSSEWESVYNRITRLNHPTFQDLKRVQQYLIFGKRAYLKWVATNLDNHSKDPLRYDVKVRGMRLLNSRGRCDLEPNILQFNKNSSSKDCCIVCYASFNDNFGYPAKLHLRKKNYQEVHFSGDLVFQNGGWPNTQEGSLALSHIPYAFKVCMFKEAKRLGYKKVLWLDTSFEALKNFDSIFHVLEEEGVFFLGNNGHLGYETITSTSNTNLLNAFSITKEESQQIPQLAAGIIGINLESDVGNTFLDNWYDATKNIHNSLSPRPEQNLISFIAYQLGLKPKGSLLDYCAIYREEIAPHHYFFIAY